MKTHYSCAELAAMKLPGFSGTRQGWEEKVKRENWPFIESKSRGRGGVKREYQPPKSLLSAILEKHIQVSQPGTVSPLSVPALPSSAVAAGLFMPPAPALRDEDKTTAQRAGEHARKQVLAAIVRLRDAAGCSQEAAMTTLLTNARTGKVDAGLDAMLRAARDKRGRLGDGYPSVRSLKRWLKAPDLTPLQKGKDISVKPWHALAVALRQRPQGSSLTWIHDQIEGSWDKAWGLEPPSYHVVRRFFNDKFSQIDQLKGRYTGSQLRAHRFYQHRTADGYAPADMIHADGWNTHFTAPHPVTGEFVTYEVWHFHDVATRYVTAPGIGLTENAEVIARGLENAIRELGVMIHLQTDSTKVVKGSDRFTKAMHSLEERLGFTWIHPKEVGNSQANGIAENFNTSWLDRRSRELATYQNKNSMDDLTFKRVKKLTADMVKAASAGDLAQRNAKKREAERMGKGLVFDSHDQAVAWINRIFSEFNDRPHRSLKKIADPATGRKRHQTPREALEEHRANGWEPVALTEAELIDAFRPHVVVKVTRETVSPYGGMRYKNSDVLGHWNGKQVVVAYDIHDYSQVWVKDLQGALICVAAFVPATGHIAKTAQEDGDEKRTLATLRRLEKKRETVLARNPGTVIEHQGDGLVPFKFDAVPAEAELVSIRPEAPAQEEETSYMDTIAMLRKWQEETDGEKTEEEVAASS